MKRIAAVLAFATVACSSNPVPGTAQRAPAQESDSPPTLRVNGSASVKRAPDVAVIQLAVETTAQSAAEASAANAERMAAVLRSIRDLGVPSSQIRTRRLELQPRYDSRRDRDTPPEIVGYRALNQVSVRLDDVEGTGAVVDAGIRAGANRVTGIQFELSDPEGAYHEALRNAIASARAEAEVAASALELRLGDAIQVSTGGFRPPSTGTVYEMAAMRAADSSPPVEPGEIEVEATVSIIWRLER
jgi:uncharacterized protein YggE